TPTPTPTPSKVPAIHISELLIDPKGVEDDLGEWIELVNLEPEPVNLAGWVLSDFGTDRHVIAGDLVLLPGHYVVLARNGDPARNGAVYPAYVYAGFSLANGEDELVLTTPWGVEAERLVWGSTTALRAPSGATLERTSFAPTEPPEAAWTQAHTPWSVGNSDLGSPGVGYQPPAPTATPTFTPAPTATATLVATATPIVPPTAQPVSPLPTPTVTTVPTPLPRVLISEFLADPAAVGDEEGEWIELLNAADSPVNLAGWTLKDEGSDSHTIGVNLVIQPGGYVLLARNGDRAVNGGVPVDYVYSGISLANGDDELILLGPTGNQSDSVAWGGVSGLSLRSGISYERTAFGPPAEWAYAQSPWSGSAGDFGTPLGPFVAPPPTATPTAIPTPTSAPTAAPTATPTPVSGGDPT
ncbi:MAG: lamin tail domain-containing protein, partial [Caldilineaceae bacterium]|nr:lamin tail domain-containing protein [Caldilineaceae bacterium]